MVLEPNTHGRRWTAAHTHGGWRMANGELGGGKVRSAAKPQPNPGGTSSASPHQKSEARVTRPSGKILAAHEDSEVLQRIGRQAIRAFNLSELLVVLAVLAVLAAVALPVVRNVKARARLAQCTSNLNRVGRAVLMFADANRKALPLLPDSPPPGGWWWYKEKVKSYIGLNGPSSPNDTVFACPSDRGYGDAGQAVPFCRSAKHDFTSYVFNGVNLPGVPNIAGRDVTTLKEPAKTLLVMEWTAHAPLSWHRSRTGQANTPFYNDAESVVTFVDGHTAFIKIYFDGINPAYTRDPISGYDYKYSGD